MPHVDFLIANAGHHLAAARPVARELSERGFGCRLVSLCELRGLASPAEDSLDGLGVLRLVPHRFRRSPSRAGGHATPARKLRSVSQRLFWHLYLARRVRRWLESRPDVVTVPNDGAFPYDRICARLRSRGIPFVVLQEGIRFTETVFQDSGIVGQGRSGADAFACWGETSAEFFCARGAPPERIRLTGTPRFDRMEADDSSHDAEVLDRSLPTGGSTLTVLTNPIDLWGFCSEQEKMALLERLVDELEPLLENDGWRLVFKIHRQESLRSYRALVEGHRLTSRLAVLADAPLYPLLRLSDAAVVLASTVGLEALLLGVPLAVLEIPGHGYLHDYVSSGVARGLSWNAPLAPQVRALLGDDPSRNRALADYLDRTLAARGRSADAVAELIAELAASSGR